jgi:glucan-binding YG repeat protein
MPEEPEEKNQMELAIKANNLKSHKAPLSGPDSAHDLQKDPQRDPQMDLQKILAPDQLQTVAKPIKIRMAYKAVVFCFSVITLSWFFEGMRQCKETASAQGLAYLLGGTLLTLFWVGTQGFFIYCEERSKGMPTRKIAVFDKWYLFLIAKQKGDYSNRG